MSAQVPSTMYNDISTILCWSWDPAWAGCGQTRFGLAHTAKTSVYNNVARRCSEIECESRARQEYRARKACAPGERRSTASLASWGLCTGGTQSGLCAKPSSSPQCQSLGPRCMCLSPIVATCRSSLRTLGCCHFDCRSNVGSLRCQPSWHGSCGWRAASGSRARMRATRTPASMPPTRPMHTTCEAWWWRAPWRRFNKGCPVRFPDIGKKASSSGR
eukprot:347894-Chlamydomonas_euryale.AAC.3